MEFIKKEIQQAVDLYKLQKYYQAEMFTRKLMDENPKIAFLYNLLGLILDAQKKYDEAIKYYEKGISIKPDYAMIYSNLGNIYKIKEKYEDAENCYKKSITLNDKLPEPQNNLGNLYIYLNKYTEAINSFKKSIKNNINFYIAYFNLGILYKNIGNINESKKCLHKAINLKPNFCSAHRAYSQINKYKIGDKHINVMENLYKQNNLSALNKMEITFALGKAFDDIKNYKKAFKYYSEGNFIRRSKLIFSFKDEKKEFRNIKKFFNKSFFIKNKNIGIKDSTPIFILGMPRSGTTLVEQIISSHPDVYGGGELNYFNNIIKKFFYKDGYFSLNKAYQIKSFVFKEIGNEYLEKIKKISPKNRYVTDKLPINFKWIGFIKLIFPNSKIVLCTRNPQDTCLSIYKNYFTNNELNYAYKFDELILFYKYYKNLIEFWKKHSPKSIIDVKYESLIKNTQKEIPKLIKNCNLNWNANCFKFYKNERIVKTASDAQVRNKIYKNSINSWKNYKKYLNKDFVKFKY